MELTIRQKLVSAITEYDRQNESKLGFNKYALGQYFIALGKAEVMVDGHETWKEAIYTWFCGPLERKLQRVILKDSKLKGGV